jgi:hypothetical protein
MIRPLNESEVFKKLHRQIIKQENGCWEWTGTRLPVGYGLFRVLGEQLAHRVSFILKHRMPIGDFFICHKCDNPPCVNPDHLFIGTNKSNMQDAKKKNRTRNGNTLKTVCIRGHELNEENTYFAPSGARHCRVCSKLWMRKRRSAE